MTNRNILAPTDLSENSIKALKYALDLANESNDTLHILYVSQDALNETEKKSLFQEIASYADSFVDLNCIKRLLAGNPANVIVKYARENKVELIVMGTHGRTGLSHLVLGSVAENVLRKSPCPVTVLGPHDGENATLHQAVNVLEKMIGEDWKMERETGRTLMCGRLVESLRISTPNALQMITELENLGWIIWEDGIWSMVKGRELIES